MTIEQQIDINDKYLDLIFNEEDFEILKPPKGFK